MENPIVTVDNAEENFFLSLAVSGSFPIKATVFFSDGMKADVYGNFTLSHRGLLF